MSPVFRLFYFMTFVAITVLTGCSGGGSGPATGAGAAPAGSGTVTGVAATGAPLRGTVFLTDSSETRQKRERSTDSEGSYTFNVSGMTAPFMIKAVDSSDPSKKYYSIATEPGITNVTPLTSIVVADATGSDDLGDLFENYKPGELKLYSGKMAASGKALQTALAPLLALSNAQNTDLVNGVFQANHSGIDAVMDSVKVVLNNGNFTISNTSSPTVPIFTAQLGMIGQGRLNLSAQQNVPTVQSAGSVLYTSKCAGCHGVITTTSLKSRATLALTKAAVASNRGGMNILAGLSDNDIQSIVNAITGSVAAPAAAMTPAAPVSQVPTVTPPAVSPAAIDGGVLYSVNCAGCHGSLASTRKTGTTMVRLQNAISGDVGGMGALASLSAAELDAVVLVLNPVGSTPAAVPPAPVQVPAPAPTPTPAPVPAPAVDGAAAYAASCAACHRPLVTSTKSGTTTARLDSAITNNAGGMGFLSNLTTTVKNAIIAVLAPILPAPSPLPMPVPAPGPAVVDGAALYAANCAGCHGSLATSTKAGATTTRTQNAINGNVGGMGYLAAMPATDLAAITTVLTVVTVPVPVPAPTPAPTPTPTPTVADGAALYAANCAGCHGALASSNKIGITISRLQNSINSNIAGMGTLSRLTVSEVQAIVTVLTPSTPTPTPAPGPAPTPAPVDGATLYAVKCAGCHGALATSSKAGATAARTQNAISGNIGGMGYLSTLSATDIAAIVAVLPAAVIPAPTPTPVDGAALYAANCAGCHGALATSGKAGATAVRTQNAISGNVGGMGYLSTLSATDIAAIVAVLPAAVIPTPSPTPIPVDGVALYAANCAGCHGALAASTKAGATAVRTQTAINGNIGGMGYLTTLSATNVSAIASALATVTPSPTPAPSLACGSCHAIPPATAKHAKHASKNIACSSCHGGGYSKTTVNVATHNNGVKNIDTANTGWNATKRTCANSCHGTETWN